MLKKITISAGQQQAAAAGAQLLLLALLGVTMIGWLAGLAYATGLGSVLAWARHRRGRHRFGPADHVTLTRAVLVGGVTALVAEHAASGPVFISLASVALILDAVDGRIARRTGTASPFGARFDMEVDAFLILVLSVDVAMSLGPWVLAIGLMRYGFVMASWAASWLRSALPASFARKTVAALQGILLVFAGSGIVTRPVAVAVTALALAALVWSFGRDVVWLWRNRPAPAGADARSRLHHAPRTGILVAVNDNG